MSRVVIGGCGLVLAGVWALGLQAPVSAAPRAPVVQGRAAAESSAAAPQALLNRYSWPHLP